MMYTYMYMGEANNRDINNKIFVNKQLEQNNKCPIGEKDNHLLRSFC